MRRFARGNDGKAYIVGADAAVGSSDNRISVSQRLSEPSRLRVPDSRGCAMPHLTAGWPLAWFAMRQRNGERGSRAECFRHVREDANT